MDDSEKYQGYQWYRGYERYCVCQGYDGLEALEVSDGYEGSEDTMFEKEEEVYISEAEVTKPTEKLEEEEEEQDEYEYFDAMTTLENEPATDFPNKDGNPLEKSENTAFLDSIFGKLPPKSTIKAKLLFPKPAYPNQRAKSNRQHRTQENEAGC